MITTLTMFNTGQVTLPKSWRSKYNTKNFTATVTSEGLLIKPILELSHSNTDVSYYESPEGFGIYSDTGIDPQDIILSIQKLQANG